MRYCSQVRSKCTGTDKDGVLGDLYCLTGKHLSLHGLAAPRYRAVFILARLVNKCGCLQTALWLLPQKWRTVWITYPDHAVMSHDFRQAACGGKVVKEIEEWGIEIGEQQQQIQPVPENYGLFKDIKDSATLFHFVCLRGFKQPRRVGVHVYYIFLTGFGSVPGIRATTDYGETGQSR